MTELKLHHCSNCGQPTDIMARFCQNCGQPLQETQSQPGPGYPPQSTTGAMHPSQRPGPGAGKIIAWIVGALFLIFIGIPIALGVLIILFRILGLF
jgi:uncharacterized membrane protein YvbJ